MPNPALRFNFFLIFISILFSCQNTHAQESLSEEVFKQYRDNIEFSLNKGDKSNAAYYMNKIAYSYWVNGMYDKAINEFEKVQKINSEIGNKSGIAGIYAQMAAIYTDMGKYDLSLDQLEKEIQIRKEMGKKRELANSYLNYVEALINLNKFTKALEFLEKTKEISIELKDKRLLRSVYGRMADVYGKTGDSEKQSQNFEIYKTFDNEIKQDEIKKTKKESADKINEISSIAKEEKEGKQKAQNQLISTEQELDQQKRITKEQILQIQLLKTEEENKELKIRDQDSKIRLQQVVSISVSILALLLILIAFTLFQSNRQKRIVNKELSRLNTEILIKNNEIKIQNIILAEKNNELIELNNEKNYMVGIVAHDLKSPMNRIKGLTDVFKMTSPNLTKDQNDIIQMMLNTVEKAQSFIGRILDVNALESKELGMSIQENDLYTLTEKVITDHLNYANSKRISLKLTKSGIAFYAMIDKESTIQIVDNLISNAIKFSQFDKEVSISVLEKSEVIRLEIQDQGPGLSDDDLKKIFGKFQKLSAQPTYGESSTGLGLSIVKKYVDAMRGRVWCESTPQNGAKFIVEFEKSAATKIIM